MAIKTIDFTDIYEDVEFVEAIKKKHIPLDDETLAIGEFGYLGENFANLLQNAAIASAEYSLEAIPTKAKFPRNVLTHAHAVGLTEINATPSWMKVVLYIPLNRLDNNLIENKFTLDKNFPITISGLEFHLDYDIVIKKVKLLNGNEVYTAQYDMSVINPLSNIYNPYLSSLGRFKIGGVEILAIQTQIRQIEMTTQELTLYTSNPLENKTFQFSFDSQLASFSVSVNENGTKYDLAAVYDGLIDKSAKYYCNYIFMDTNTIRVMFNKASYQPRANCVVDTTVLTTQGAAGNITYNQTSQYDLKSDRFPYNSIWMILKPLTDAVDGLDAKSISDLRKLIPSEQLARGTITNTTDLDNYFNSINTDNRRIYFIKKMDSLERLYYSYIILKDTSNKVIPTNTININIFRTQFNNIDNDNYILYPGNAIYYRKNSDGVIIVDKTTLDSYRKKGFLYMNPFLMVVNKNPFYVSYLVNIIDVVRDLSFTYINQNSALQFISDDISWKREYFTDRDTYKLTINLMQNIDTDEFHILQTEEDEVTGETIVTGANMKIIAVLKNEDNVPIRYSEANFVSYNEDSKTFTYEFDLETDNAMDADINLKITNVKNVGATYEAVGYFPETTNIDIYVLVMLDTEYGRGDTIDTLVPGLDGYTLTNMYSIVGGVPMYYNYSKVISTMVNVDEGFDVSLKYSIMKVPVIAYDYVITESRIQNFINQFELVRNYIEYKLDKVEDSFGIDMKLFNTYGPAFFFGVGEYSYINNVSLSLKFRVLPKSNATETLIEDIKTYIKSYIEDVAALANFHAPNLQAAVTDEFKEQIEYFEFVDFNGYGPSFQHIYRDEFESDVTKVPEFINVATNTDDEPDITIENMG